ncbi:alpha/beta hydrolase [Entomohabitans teleogrylli]|uniref:alpha/beta hydrolase n=1 Tax=Entomohabitans teleogrylli TaxID=1384589 RepID=UPI0009E8F3DD|nr:alpha/beta hydrolase [Entomohabitans teleogrylli]
MEQGFPVWPQGEAPGAACSTVHFSLVDKGDHLTLQSRAAFGVRAPEITVYTPEEPNGVGILVIPGGGFERVVVDKEGSDLAPVFTAHGYTLFVMTYRLPGDGHAEGADAPLADAQRALRAIKTQAAGWGVDPQRLGVLGFSAGGHVAASLSTRYQDSVYAPLDVVDEQDARPAFNALIYPVISMRSDIAHAGSRLALLGEDPSPEEIQRYSPDARVTEQTPPTFLVHAADDPAVPVDNTLAMFCALRRQGVPVEMHIFSRGKHGFAIRDAQDLPARAWPELLMNWLESFHKSPAK